MRPCWLVALFVVVKLGHFTGCVGPVVEAHPNDEFRYEFLVDMTCTEHATGKVKKLPWWFTVREIEEVAEDAR